MRIALRLALTSAVIAGAAAFAILFGPGVGRAHADIYWPLVDAAGFLVPPPGSRGQVTRGDVLVNGQTFHYLAGRSGLSLGRVLDSYEQQFQSSLGAGAPLNTASRIEGQGAGIVSGIRFGRVASAEVLRDRAERFAHSTRLADLGAFHMVAAFADRGTTFIEFTAGADVRLDTLLPRGSDDAPGDEPAGVRRPAGFQRLLTIEHGRDATWSRTTIYRDRRPDRRGANAFVEALRRGGWTADPVVAGRISHYTNGGDEAFVGDAASGDMRATILVYRRNTRMRAVE
jgi:hypothetical protein